MKAPSSIPPMVSKLIARLGSDHDGEILATVDAIKRTLRNAGCDLHDLAGAISPAAIAVGISPTPAGSWRSQLAYCQARSFLLREHEREFVRQLAARPRAWTGPFPKQRDWLAAIYARLWTERRP